MLTHCGTFDKIVRQRKEISIPLSDLKEGVNSFPDLIIAKRGEEILYVIDRVCDHAGGKLTAKGETAYCPLHGWKLDLGDLRYDNGIKKNQQDYRIEAGRLLVEVNEYELRHPRIGEQKRSKRVSIRFISHACVAVTVGDFTLITDPWLIGPAFLGGWWLDPVPKSDALDILQSADLVFISHNHPDHMHEETLAMLPSDQAIITPNYTTGSSRQRLEDFGFNNIQELSFTELYHVEGTDLELSILKSGDFRDDSGLYLNIDGIQLLFNVDSNYLNHFVLPTGIDALLATYSTDASGFPVCFSDLNDEEIRSVYRRKINARRASLAALVKATQPRYFLPYASYFTPAARRDTFVRQRLGAPTIADFAPVVHAAAEEEIIIIDPREKDRIELGGDKQIKLDSTNLSPLYKVDEDYVKRALANLNNAPLANLKILSAYFSRSEFHLSLHLYLIPGRENFEPDETAYLVVFREEDEATVSEYDSRELINLYETHDEAVAPALSLLIRREILAKTVAEMLPWEDFMIGYQAKVRRKPEVYQADFWYHFTNRYIRRSMLSYGEQCGACTRIERNGHFVRRITN